MDKDFELSGIRFVWDEAKARRNPGKHGGVTFEQAAEAFFNPFLRVIEASREDEKSHAVIGMDRRWTLLFVVHTKIEETFIRIISARKATREERRLYED